MRRWWETIMPRILVSPVAAATRTYNENLEFKTTGTPATPSSSSRSRDPTSDHLLEWALRTRIGCDDTESREGPESRAAVPVGGGRAWRASSHTSAHQAPLVWRAPEGPEGTGGLRDNAPSHTPAHQVPLVWRAPEGPEGTGGLRGAAPNKVRSPSLAGGRALRRPEHPWGRKQHEAARPHRGPGGSRIRPLAAISEGFSASGCRRSPDAGRPRQRGRPCRPRPTCPTYAGRTASSRRPRRRS